MTGRVRRDKSHQGSRLGLSVVQCVEHQGHTNGKNIPVGEATPQSRHCMSDILRAGCCRFPALGFGPSHPKKQRTRALFAALLFAAFWLLLASLACWLLLAYCREELKISDRHVTQQGVIGRREFDLHSIAGARWRIVPRPGGSLVLRSLTEKMTIYFGNFEPLEGLWLIRSFRNGLPMPVQEDWALFCSKIALPLRDQTRRFTTI